MDAVLRVRGKLRNDFSQGREIDQHQRLVTAKQVRAPGCMRRSFRTLRLCAIPGVSPRAGMRCPVGALRTLTSPEPSSAPPPGGSGTGPEQALEAIKPSPRAQRESPILPRASLRAQARSRGAPTHDSPQAPAQRPNHPAAAGPGRSEHWKRSNLPPAHSAKAQPAPTFPTRARPIPRSPCRDPDPQRQPRHSATAKQVRPPGCMRRSFRTLRLCAIPGVSPRAGMRCPVGALRTPHLPRAFQYASTQRQRDRAGASIGSDQTSPPRTARKPHPPPSFPASAGPIPRSPSRP
jgi:hypothetical protein